MSATYKQTPFPQETQFAGVLQMGVQELRDYVETALQENPVFELSDPGEEMLEDPNFARKRSGWRPATGRILTIRARTRKTAAGTRFPGWDII